MPSHDSTPATGARPERIGRANRLRAIEIIEAEIDKLAGKLGSYRGRQQRELLIAKIDHLREVKASFIGLPRRRKPPEAGLPVPAVPPRGPLPLQGGAQAPLEFDD